MILLTLGRQRVKEVLADERDYNIAGTAARYSITIFAVIMMVGIFAMMALKDKNPEFANIASLLAYLTCALMFINALVFRFLKIKETNDKEGLVRNFRRYLPFIILAFISVALIAIASLRMFTPEDGWICQNGTWARHGNPGTTMPADSCR